MLLKTLTYQDKSTGWTLQNLRLDRFNLLVGASGVGKTRILRAVRQIRTTAFSRTPDAGLVTGTSADVAISFTLTFEHQGQDYTWEFESEPRDENEAVIPRHPNLRVPKTVVSRERLTSATEGVLIERHPHSFVFRGNELPQLNRSESALVLVDEPSVQQVSSALFRFLLDNPSLSTSDSFLGSLVGRLLSESTPKSELRLRLFSLGSATTTKAFVLQERFPEDFASIKEAFIEIFPSVQDVSVAKLPIGSSSEGEQHFTLRFELKEQDVPVRIPAEDFSSGMLRTLIHLVDLWLAPPGTVVLIDEFENSLGVNCMGPLTEFIQSRASELQFIITSHHPYIINQIPKSYWKVVRRKGSVVRVTPASEIRALQGTSAQDDFTRLLNSPEFEEGLA
ncbi:MAG TPA: ATP-binding protein [Myxococcus sp.]|nr:ATP-binding protein [Myxococcus sp.]